MLSSNSITQRLHQNLGKLVKSNLKRTYSIARNTVFPAQSAELIARVSNPESFPEELQGVPEIIVTGRANVGKSSLLNSIIGRRSLLSTSKKAGHTRTLDFYCIGKGHGDIVLVDAPGYGSRGRPDWGALFDAYIQSRQSLARIYILLNAKHGVQSSDKEMLSHLRDLSIDDRGVQRWSIQPVLTKADCLHPEEVKNVLESAHKDVFASCNLALRPLFTSTVMSPPVGIEELRDNIQVICGRRPNPLL